MCLNKVPVLDKETNKIKYYPCGKCYECINRKTSIQKQLCQNEFELNKECLFITLTYANEHLPYCSVEVQFHPTEHDKYLVSYISQCDRMTEYYMKDVIHDEVVDVNRFRKFYLPIISNKFNIGYGNVPVLFRQDVKNYIKRIRERLTDHISRTKFNNSFKKLQKHEKEKVTSEVKQIRTYICGEYGPVHFRPHFHILLFYNDSALFDILTSLALEAWSYGRIDVQPASGDAGTYVSGYVNSLISTPPIISVKPFRPSSQHSLFFGINASKEFNTDIKEKTYRSLKSRYVVTDGKFQAYKIPMSLENRLFPKSYRFSKASDYELLKLYRLYRTFSMYFGTKSVKEIVEKYFEHFNIELPFENKYDLLKNNYRPEQILYLSENEESTLYSILYTSKKFLRNCQIYDISEHEYFNIIKTYYNDKDSFTNRTFFANLDIDSSVMQDYKYLVTYYDNIVPDINYYLQKFKDTNKRNIRMDELRMIRNFADSFRNGMKLSDVFDALKNPNQFKEHSDHSYMQEKICKDSIKHKYQNDLNEIFL